MRYKCNNCESIFIQKSSLSTHIKSVHLGEEFHCRTCDFKASTKSNLSQHVKNIHVSNGKMNCDECNKPVKFWSLRSHKMRFHPGEKRKFQ